MIDIMIIIGYYIKDIYILLDNITWDISVTSIIITIYSGNFIINR
jgi:hypothetical protein